MVEENKRLSGKANSGRMPRLDVADLNDPQLDQILENARKMSTPSPAWYQTLASNPQVAKAFAHYWDTVFRRGRVEHEIKELMRIYVARLLGCSFCYEQRSVQAIESGLDEQTIQSCTVADFDSLNPRARAALRYARELALDNATKDPARFDAIYRELHNVFDDAEIMELGGLCVLFIGGSHLARSLGMD